MTEQYNGQTYLEYANRAAVKIRKISKLAWVEIICQCLLGGGMHIE